MIDLTTGIQTMFEVHTINSKGEDMGIYCFNDGTVACYHSEEYAQKVAQNFAERLEEFRKQYPKAHCPKHKYVVVPKIKEEQ